MSTFGRLHRATAIVPLAVLSAAWTASLAGVGVGSASADPDGPGTLPDGTVLPAAAIEAPASVGDAVSRAAALTPGSASSIPQAALAAYQRAEAVINKADPGCALPWELVAAIGRVESDHGRFGGSTLSEAGTAVPGIVGIALDGSHGTSRITDTDAGQYDGDAVFDRAVGPMQFIPSTWSVVGVDADGDARRDPQDIHDAALATAVYLCSGDEALDTDAGRRTAVHRYNHSRPYVDLVLSIMDAYLGGDYTAVPNDTTSTSYFLDDVTGPQTVAGPGHHSSPGQSATHAPTATPPGSHHGPGPTAHPTAPPAPGPTSIPTSTPPAPNPPDPVGTVTDTVDTVLTQAQAVAQCTLDGENALLDRAGWDACLYDYTH